jgi:DNA-binding PucR family transcriptional regulator
LLRHYRDLHIGALVREDARGILQETLRVYLEQGGSQRQTAEVLGIHRNTLGYRLRQIRQVLTVDLDAPNTRLTLHLALIGHKMISG